MLIFSPSGIIGHNLLDAEETVNTIDEDVQNNQIPTINNDNDRDIVDLLYEKRVSFVEWDEWKRIDSFEQESKLNPDSPRTKLISIDSMIEVAKTEE